MLLALLVACMVPHATAGPDLVGTPAPPICILGVNLTANTTIDTLEILFAHRPLPAELDSVRVWTEANVRPECDLHIRARPYYLVPAVWSDFCRPTSSRTEASGHQGAASTPAPSILCAP